MHRASRRTSVCALAVALAASAALHGAGQPPPKDVPAICRAAGGVQPVIDAHLHAVTAASVQRLRSAGAALDFEASVPLPADDDELLRQTMSTMDRFHIVRAVVSGPPQAMDRWLPRGGDRFIPSALVRDASTDLHALRDAFATRRMRVMGEVGFQYEGLAPNDPSADPYFALAEELDVPVGIHLYGGGAPSPKFRVALGNPLLLEEVVLRHPKLRVYVMHAGMPFIEGMLAMLRRYPQVYADLSQINYAYPREQFHDYLQALMRAGFGRRLMFGSDATRGPHVIGPALDGIASAPFLTEAQRADILCGNAARFFHIE